MIITCLPKRHWVIESYETERPQVRVTCQVQYQGEGATPMPKTVSVSMKGDNGAEQNNTTEILSLTLKEIPDAEFTLSAFGLKEPLGVTWDRPTPWYIWLSVVAISCLVLGFGLHWFRRRYLTTSAKVR
jgi:hypothetical protein